ncbi:hypothetical protein QYE76_031767 [Lolium multiflorum]|uniref:Uncharacterized protein n=1 Tax=Lolium multiflorum TaxID=4521 RepID=A0AAD8QU73_LOLMU|nr:hypothetical protein QYE76_031767 [Lolium multiflorum]
MDPEMVKLARALDFPRSEVYYDVIEKMNFKVTYTLRAKRVERWIRALKRDFLDAAEIKERTNTVETQLGKIAESQTIILARFACKPEPNPVEDLKMMRIEISEALEELDYSNAPTPEYSVQDLIMTVTEAATYRHLTLEFLSTLKHTVNHYYKTKENQPGVERISFRLMNCGMRIPSTLPQGNSIECLAIRYLYYVIANTLQARGDFTRLNEEDMMILAKAVFPQSNLLPNLGAILVLYLNHQALEARGPICGGGVITVLARRLSINVRNLRALEDPRRLGFTTPDACGMVRKIEGRYYFNMSGVDHLITAPLPDGLFSLEERHLHYDVQVDANLPPQQDEPEEEEEVEQEPQGPEQEQQPLHDFTTY